MQKWGVLTCAAHSVQAQKFDCSRMVCRMAWKGKLEESICHSSVNKTDQDSHAVRHCVDSQEANPMPIWDIFPKTFDFIVDIAARHVFIKQVSGFFTGVLKFKKHLWTFLGPINTIIVMMKVVACQNHIHSSATKCLCDQRSMCTNRMNNMFSYQPRRACCCPGFQNSCTLVRQKRTISRIFNTRFSILVEKSYKHSVARTSRNTLELLYSITEHMKFIKGPRTSWQSMSPQ